MALLAIKNFLGLRTGVSEPEVGASIVANNFRRNRVRGQLELADGYKTNLTIVPTTYGITSLVPVSFKSFYVSDQGGRVITAALCTYTKTGLGYGLPASVNTSGIFTRPYYNGAAWVDDWQEVTEFQVVNYASATGHIVTLSNSPALPGWAADYFKGWVIFHGSIPTVPGVQTGFRVNSSSGATLTFEGSDTDLSGWAGGDLLYLCRSNFGIQFPATLNAQFRGILDELRLNTGSTTSDLDAAVFYRDKTFFQGISQALKGTFGEYGQLNVPALSHKLANAQRVAGAVDADGNSTGLPAGTYTLKTTVKMDDGQETGGFDSLLGGFPESIVPAITGSAFLPPYGPALATDGTFLYCLGQYSIANGGPQAIYKIDKDTLTVLATYVVPPNAGLPIYFIAVGCYNSFVYGIAEQINALGGYGYPQYQTIIKLSTNLEQLAFAGGGIADQTVGTTQYLLTRQCRFIGGQFYDIFYANQPFSTVGWYYHVIDLPSMTLLGPGCFITPQSIGTPNFQVIGYSITEIFVADESNAASAYIHHITKSTQVDGGAVLVAASGGHSIVGCTYAGNLYVGFSNLIYKVNVGTYVPTLWVTLAGGSVLQGEMINDGTYLFCTDATHIYPILLASGTVTASYVPAVGTGSRMVFTGSIIYTLGSPTDTLLRSYEFYPAASSFVSLGHSIIQYDLLISCGLVPRRAASICVYISKDGGEYYLVKEHSILLTGETFGASSTYNATMQHRYFTAAALQITAADYTDASTLALDTLGRTIGDMGVNRYTYALTANKHTYAIGVEIAGALQASRIYSSPLSDQAVPMYDVLPNDESTILDVEYNDGDYALALGGVSDRILVLKSRSLVMLTPQADGSYSRDLVATGIGICAINSLVSSDEALYWLDHSGVWQFTTGGLKKMSAAIDNDLFQFSDDQRIAAQGCVDPKNTQYRLLIGGYVYICDLADGEWMVEDGSSQVWFDGDMGFGARSGGVAQNAISSRRFVQLVGTNLQTPAEQTFAGTASWESAKIELPLERGYDGLVSAIYIDYDMLGTRPTVTLSLLLDENPVPAKTYTLPTGKYEVTVPAPLAARCKTFKLRLDAVSTLGQAFKIRRLGAYFNQFPSGGNQQLVASGNQFAYNIPTAAEGDCGGISAPKVWTTGKELTIECWYRLNHTLTNFYNFIVGMENGFTFVIASDTGTIWWCQPGSNLYPSGFYDTGVAVVVGETHHYAFVIDSADVTGYALTIYRDGQVVYGRTYTPGNVSNIVAASPLDVGRGPGLDVWAPPHFPGLGRSFPALSDYDEVRVWNIARSQKQIQNNMGLSLAHPQPNLVACWGFDNFVLTGTANIIDSVNNATPLKNDGTPITGILGSSAGLF